MFLHPFVHFAVSTSPSSEHNSTVARCSALLILDLHDTFRQLYSVEMFLSARWFETHWRQRDSVGGEWVRKKAILILCPKWFNFCPLCRYRDIWQTLYRSRFTSEGKGWERHFNTFSPRSYFQRLGNNFHLRILFPVHSDLKGMQKRHSITLCHCVRLTSVS
jgi:hypothetical protein